MLFAMGSVLIPLVRLTSSRRFETAPSPASTAVSSRELEILGLEITTAGGPASLEVTHLGEIVWQGKVDTTETCALTVNFPQEGIELGVFGELESGNHPGAVKISVRPPGSIPIEKTIWTDGPIDEVLLFERQ